MGMVVLPFLLTTLLPSMASSPLKDTFDELRMATTRPAYEPHDTPGYPNGHKRGPAGLCTCGVPPQGRPLLRAEEQGCPHGKSQWGTQLASEPLRPGRA